MTIEQDFEVLREAARVEDEVCKAAGAEPLFQDALSRIEADRETEAEVMRTLNAANKRVAEERDEARHQRDALKAVLEEIASGSYFGVALTPESFGVAYKVKKRMSRLMMRRIARRALQELADVEDTEAFRVAGYIPYELEEK